MNDDIMNYLALAAAGIFTALGLLHLVYTLQDFGAKPRYFRPRDAALLPAMRATQMGIAPGGRDYWSGILGFNLSHSIGVLLLALLIAVATLYEITWLEPVLVAVGIALAGIAWRCWFRVPMWGCLIGTALMIVGWAA
jgi:hypothetical protein